MMHRIRRAALALCACLLLTATGCQNYSYNEPEDLQFVAGMAIDRTPTGEMQLAVELESSKAGENTELKASYLYAKGINLEDAKRNMLRETSKALYWGHMDLVIISQEIAQSYMNDVIDLLTRSHEMRLGMRLAMSLMPTAAEALTMKRDDTNGAPLNSDNITNSLKIQKRLGKAPEIKLYQFVDDVLDEGAAAYMPTVCMKSDDESSGEVKQLMVAGTALFHSSYLTGVLDENETRTMLITTGIQKVTVLPLPMDPQGAFSNATVELLPDRVDIKPSIVDGKPVVDITLHCRFTIVEINGASNDPDQFKPLCEAVTRNAAMTLEAQVVALMEKTKTMDGGDVLSIGSRLQDKQPELWKQINGKWNDLYRQMKVNVRAEMKLENTGLLPEPLRKGD